MVTANAWPSHFHHRKGQVKCIVCFSPLPQYVIDIIQHADAHDDFEHQIFQCMLRQSKCAFCDHTPLRKESMISFFRHELSAHGTAHMSTLTSFVALTRLGLTSEAGEKALEPIFNLMVQKIQLSWAAKELVMRAGFPIPMGQVSSDVIAEIVTPVELRPGGGEAPRWTPVPKELFLWDLRPLGWGDDRWGVIWSWLRGLYAEGDL